MARYVDAKELAELLSLSVRTVFRLRDDGKLPASVKLGRCVRWDLDKVIAFLDAQEEEFEKELKELF